MMRFQRVSPDYLPFSNDNSNGNGKKSNLRTTPTATATTTTTCKERERENFDSNSNYDGVKALRFRSPSKNTQDNSNSNTVNATSPPLSENQNHNQGQRLDSSPSHGGDVLLQWGQKKRARLSRTEIRSVTVTHHSPSPSPSSSIHNLQRRGSPFLDNKLPPPSHSSSTTRPSTLRTKETSGFIPNTNRNLEDRSAAANASPSRNPPAGNTRAVSRSTAAKTSPSPDNKTDKKVIPCSASRKDEKPNPNPNPNGSLPRLPDHNTHLDSAPLQLDQEPATTTNNTLSMAMAGGGGEKVNNIEVIEWPKIYVALSRKEKEDDFLAMKGTKLPHRPKKRAKNIDRALQYCFPGMWLSDLTKSRYEVREKKSVKKQKRRGLKGMESMDSDSE